MKRFTIENHSFRIGIDVGGTFTDIVLIRGDGSIESTKVLSTPPAFSEGILHGLTNMAETVGTDLGSILSKTNVIFGLGATVADNAVFTGKGAKVGLITTRGFEDTLIMARGALGRWSGLTESEIKHVIANEKPRPIVPKNRIRGIIERTDYSGKVLIGADEDNVRTNVESIQKEGAESFAVSLLWSFRNGTNEERVRSVIENLAPGSYVTLSSELAPFLGEYERTSTVALNAFVGPVSEKYLESLKKELKERGFDGELLIMQGYGGLLPSREAGRKAIGLIESGPAAGIRSCEFLGSMLGIKNILACDMGGTTFKVGLITDGQIEYSRNANISTYNYVMPKMDITSIGAGGGSLVTVDPDTQVPSVGPKSAEAIPGPVCYDNGGTVPTVTDVDLILGLMDPAYFLGGKMKLNKTKAIQQFEALVSEKLGLNVLEAASSIYRVANAQLADLIHKVTVERGLDPRDYTAFSYGGAGSIHMCSVCDELGISKMVVPFAASVNGALGSASSDVIYEHVATHPLTVPEGVSEINEIFHKLREQARSYLLRDGFEDKDIEMERSVDMRYRLQTHEITTQIPKDESEDLSDASIKNLALRFGELYEQKYGKGSAYKKAGVEMIAYRLKATGKLEKYNLNVRTKIHEMTKPTKGCLGQRQAFFESLGSSQADFYELENLKTGDELTGPSVILATTTTIVINPSWTAHLDSYRNVVLSKQEELK